MQAPLNKNNRFYAEEIISKLDDRLFLIHRINVIDSMK